MMKILPGGLVGVNAKPTTPRPAAPKGQGMPKMTIQTNGFHKRHVTPWCAPSHRYLRDYFHAASVAKRMLQSAAEAAKNERSYEPDHPARAVSAATKRRALSYARDWGVTAREALERFMRSRGWPGPIECRKR